VQSAHALLPPQKVAPTNDKNAKAQDSDSKDPKQDRQCDPRHPSSVSWASRGEGTGDGGKSLSLSAPAFPQRACAICVANSVHKSVIKLLKFWRPKVNMHVCT
jgi:hypothetical protein